VDRSWYVSHKTHAFVVICCAEVTETGRERTCRRGSHCVRLCPSVCSSLHSCFGLTTPRTTSSADSRDFSILPAALCSPILRSVLSPVWILLTFSVLVTRNCLVSAPPLPPVDIIWAMVIIWRMRWKVIRTVLGCCVRQLCTMICTQTYEQFLKISVGLGLGLVCVHVFRFSIFIPLFSSMVGIFSLLWHNEILVALFSYTVWPTAVKYGTITGTGA